MDLTELSEILRENGIVGAGGAGFPTYGKLSRRADTILLNCAECEPLLKLHRQLLRDHAPEILKAFSLIADVLGAERAIIGIKEEYKSTLMAVEAVIGNYPNASIHRLPGAYPMGDEVVLIYEATGRVVRPGGLPIESGVCVFNVETIYNVYRAVYEHRPVTDKLITIAGEVEHPMTVRVPIGMRIRDVVKLAGAVTCENPIYLLGGPMMGRFGSGYQPVTKTSSAVIVLPENHSLRHRMQPNVAIALNRAASICCQCRACTDLCPRYMLGHPIEPHLFMRAAANADVQDIKPFINTFFCCSCGVCETYACPQGLAPRSIMLEYKNGLRAAGIKASEAEASPVSSAREYRKLPEERLLMRLGLQKYEHEAPLNDVLQRAECVIIRLSQHIGAPAKPAVAAGDAVHAGQIVARAAEGLSVNIHASMDGFVREVTATEIVIAG